MISRLKAAGNKADAVGARLFFERLFTSADFHPPGIPQRAIVCIRKMSAPGVRGFGRGSAGGNLAADWETRVRGEIEKLFRSAYRPLREFVSAGAECVVFEDRAELLACLARDWQRGFLTENWWWRALFPKLFRAQAVAEIWLEQAEYAPAAFQILAKTGAAREFAKKLQRDETVKLLQKIIRVFGLRQLEKALFEPLDETSDPATKNLLKIAKKAQLTAMERSAIAAIAADFDSFFIKLFTEIKASDLSFEQKSLLVAAVTLARAPRMARSPEFAEMMRIERVKNEFQKEFTVKQPIEKVEKQKTLEKRQKSRVKQFREFREKSELQKSQPESPEALKSETHVLFETGDQKSEKRFEEKPSEPRETIEVKKTAEIRFEAGKPQKKAEKSEQIARQKAEPKHQKAFETKAEDRLFGEFFEDFQTKIEDSFQTRFGGVFYLLNLGLFLGLYRDFTESLEAEIDLNIWDFVALLALEFLGERIKRDEIWNFLIRVSGRENGHDFGREFNRFQDWRMPTAWLETFPKDREWLWAKQRKRLVIRHAAGFNVVDVSLGGDAEKRLKIESKIYDRYFAKIEGAKRAGFPQIKPKSRLKNLTEFLEKRLFQALNVETREELNAVLFERQATVSVSTTHLEVTFGLADLPIEIRLAGIDRDPGWIPAAGKYVYFHFA